jgi:hypothetical protein
MQGRYHLLSLFGNASESKEIRGETCHALGVRRREGGFVLTILMIQIADWYLPVLLFLDSSKKM